MEIHRKGGCDEYDALHQSRQRRGHSCSCSLSQGHGKVHSCPICKRMWGHPDIRMKATPHAGPKIRKFQASQGIQPLR